MVFYFTCSDPRFIVYMGKDKFENEKLIEWGWPEDLWFHVDSLSSAHVYLRSPQGYDISTIPADIVQECAQLVKHNSIAGTKLASTKVVYTPWENLDKREGMDVGQIGYHNTKKITKILVEKNKDMIKKLEKTRVEKNKVDLAAERKKRDRKVIRQRKREARKKREEENKEKLRLAKEKEEKSYDRVFTEDNMMSNEDMSNMTPEQYEMNFM